MEYINIKSLVEKRFTIKQIAEYLKCSKANVRYWLKKHNLKTARGPHGKIIDGIPNKSKKRFLCRDCGETDKSKFYGKKNKICGKCQNKYNIMQGRIKKEYMRKKLGGKCVVCGFKKYQCSLDIHHINPEEKDASFNSARGWSYNRIDKELAKCILLCKNCHSAFHCGEIDLNDEIIGV